MNAPLRLCVVTGVPGSGKTKVANLLAPLLPEKWVVLHADDFIGPTFSRFPEGSLGDSTGTLQMAPVHATTTTTVSSGGAFADPRCREEPSRWPQIRRYHTVPLGESAGWYMSKGGGNNNVLVEGHIKDKVEMDGLLAGINRVCKDKPETRAVRLVGEVDLIVKNLLENRNRAHQFPNLPPDVRRACFRSWLETWPVDPNIADISVTIDGRSLEAVALEVADALGLVRCV